MRQAAATSWRLLHARHAAGDVRHQWVKLVARLGINALDEEAEHGPVLRRPGREAGRSCQPRSCRATLVFSAWWQL